MKKIVIRSMICVLLCLVMLVTTLTANASVAGGGVVFNGCCVEIDFEVLPPNVNVSSFCHRQYKIMLVEIEYVGEVTHGFGFNITCIVYHLVNRYLIECRCGQRFIWSDKVSLHSHPLCPPPRF